jgi:hypothetical protein
MLLEGDPANWVGEGRAAAKAVVEALAESAEGDENAYIANVVAADLAYLADVIATIDVRVPSWIPEILGESKGDRGGAR